MRVPSSRASASAAIAAVWLSCFLVSLAVACLFFLQKKIEADSLTQLLAKLSDAYAAHLGVILAYYFATRATSLKSQRVSPSAFVTALTVSLIWNGFIAALVVGTSVEDALKLISDISPKLSWLVAPALGYFFASTGDKPGK